MSANASPPEKGNATRDDAPIDSPDGYSYHSEPGTDVFTHDETGLEVVVEKNRRPTQMHTPETSTDDVGYQGRIRGDVGESLSENDLGTREGQLEIAAEFMQAFPDGGYEPEIPDDPWQWDRVRWRGVVEGDR